MIILTDLGFFILFLYGISDFHIHEDIIINRKLKYGRKYIFLTHIGIYFTLCFILLDIIGNFKKISSSFFGTFLLFTTTLELLISILFYSILFLDERNLRSADKLDKIIRNNVIKEASLHIFPFLFLIMKFIRYKDEINLKLALLLINLFFCFYSLILIIFRLLNKEFCYPILNKLSHKNKLYLILLSFCLFNLCLFGLSILKLI
jgi:hypothetical protein